MADNMQERLYGTGNAVSIKAESSISEELTCSLMELKELVNRNRTSVQEILNRVDYRLIPTPNDAKDPVQAGSGLLAELQYTIKDLIAVSKATEDILVKAKYTL